MVMIDILGPAPTFIRTMFTGSLSRTLSAKQLPQLSKLSAHQLNGTHQNQSYHLFLLRNIANLKLITFLNDANENYFDTCTTDKASRRRTSTINWSCM